MGTSGGSNEGERIGADQVGDERFLLLLDTLPYSAFVIATGGRAEHYNSRFVEYLGFHPGPGPADRAALHHPDDRAALAAARAAGVAAGTDYVVEIRMRRHDGAFRWHRVHNKPLLRAGRLVGWLGTAVDVHEARAAQDVLEQRVQARTAELAVGEARYRELYNRTPMALQSSNPRAHLMDVNDTWLDLFGYARDDVLGRSPADFMTPASAAVYRERAWPEMLASGGAVRVVDYEFVTSAGQVFDGRVAARGTFDGAGNLVRTWAAIADVTAEKRAGRVLLQAQRMEAVGQLTAGVAHDFNNLLTAILGNLELAGRPAPPGPQAEARLQRLIAGARAAAERGARLTGQMLAFARQQRLSASAVDVNAIVDAMRPLLAATAGGAIEVTVAARPDLPPASADATQLELAILNLVINARDAMGAAGRVTIGTALVTTGPAARPEEPDAGAYVAVRVEDTGPGIAPEVRERMFEPFFTTKGAGRGSGLGLAQVLGIVKQLGGGIGVETAPGQGTAVTLLLPLADPASDGAAQPPPAPPAARARPASILVVDDDAAVRATAAMMLRDAGHTVTEAESGPAALVALDTADGAFDMLLADVAMPGMGGVELADQVRRRLPTLPTVFMTGYADEGQLPAELWTEVLRKPFDSAELEARVARAVGGSAGGSRAG